MLDEIEALPPDRDELGDALESVRAGRRLDSYRKSTVELAIDLESATVAIRAANEAPEHYALEWDRRMASGDRSAFADILETFADVLDDE